MAIDPERVETPYGEYKGAATQQPPDAYEQPKDAPISGYQQFEEPSYQPILQEAPPEQYGYQSQQYEPQQQQSAYQQAPQQLYEYQQPFYTLPPGDVGPFERTSMGMKARTAGWLCYLFQWVTGLVFFFVEKENRFVRFHAMQSILFFGGLSILEGVFRYLPFFAAIGSGLGLFGFIMWIILMVSAHRGRYYKLPIVGDLAEKLIDRIKF